MKKTFFFLFGVDPIRAMENGNKAEAKKIIKTGDGAVYAHGPDATAVDLLNAYDGWQNFKEISQEDYLMFSGDPFVCHGHYTVSNCGGYEVQISDDGSSARYKDAFGSEAPEISDWFEIQYSEDEEGEQTAVIDPQGANIDLNLVMKAL